MTVSAYGFVEPERMKFAKFALIVLAALAAKDVLSGLLWSESAFAEQLMEFGLGPNTVLPIVLAALVIYSLS